MAAAWLTPIDRQIQTLMLVVSGAALFLMGTFLVCLDLYLAKEGATRELSRQADLVGILSREAMLAHDRAAGERALSTLRLSPIVTTGILYDDQGRELARYDRPGPGPVHSAANRALRAAIGTDALALRRPVPIGTGASGIILLQADLSPIYQRATRYAALVLAILVCGLTVAWLLGSRLQRLITGPILDLIAATGTALAERDYSLRILKPGGGDLGILSERFNALLQQIQDQQRALAEQRGQFEKEWHRREDESALAHAALHDAFAERTQAEDQREQTAAEPEANRQESQPTSHRVQDSAALQLQFPSHLTHEIRTPLNSLLGLIDLLLHGPLTEQQRRHATNALASGKTLLSCLNDLAALSDLETGSLALHPMEFDLRDTVEEVLDLVRDQAQAKGLRLTSTILSTCPDLLVGDPYWLRKILGHLLGNAVQFTQQGEIALRVSAAPLGEGRVEVQFDIKDTGSGIAQEDQACLLAASPPSRGSPSGTFRGTGLGLPVVIRLVRLMGGTVGLDSEVGRGSTFWVKLPLSIGSATPQFLGEPSATVPPRILIVESHAASRQVLKHTLKGWGFHPEEASAGAKALELVRQAASSEAPFALLILDLALEDADGLSLIKTLKSEAGGPSLAVILLAPPEFDREIAREAGADLVLTKPVRYQALYRALARRLNRLTPSSSPSIIPSTSPAGMINPGAIPPQFTGCILVVEDNSVNQEVARTMLEQLGCSVEVAGNGREALEATGRARYDLVLMDCQMPEMDGFEATRRIRAREAVSTTGTPRLPIVALTAHVLESDRQACLAAGMDDYLSKPFTRLQLERLLTRWLPRPERPLRSGT